MLAPPRRERKEGGVNVPRPGVPGLETGKQTKEPDPFRDRTPLFVTLGSSAARTYRPRLARFT